jgi:carbamoyl-phosphate synthase large subunit
LEYPLKHISPSGITGTPTVSKIIVDDSVNTIGEKAVKSIDKNPHGNYAVDLKEDNDGNWYVTEIDSGKFHTTTPLWGYISTKFLKQDPYHNLPYLYTMLGLGEISDPGFLGNDIYPEGLHILRHIDCGTWLYKEDGYKEKIL